MTVSIPARLLAAAASPGGQRWLRELPARIRHLSARYQLELEKPFEPSGFWSWAAPGRDGSGRSVVLKLSLPGRADGELAALTAWGGDGAPLLYAGGPDWLLLERLEPGRPLGTAAGHKQRQMVAELLPRLWKPAAEGFTSLDTFVTEMLATLDQADPLFARAGDRVRRLDPSDERVLLHGDLHEENILLGARGYAAIDPQPLAGERAFDVEPLLRRYLDRAENPDGATSLLDVFSRLGVDRNRALAYAGLRSGYYGTLCLQAGEHERAARWRERLAGLKALA